MQKATQAELVQALQDVLEVLQDGKSVNQDTVGQGKIELLHKVFYCFNEKNIANDPDIKVSDLDTILAQLEEDDIPTINAALESAKAGRQAWLGFKIVTDPTTVLDSVDTSAWNFNGIGQGSADAKHAIFFVNASKEIICARNMSPRDVRQAKDVTAGPHMHNRQYAGVAWASILLEPTARVVMLGCGDVSVELEKVAHLCGFATIAIDDDASYINESRFPKSTRILLESFSQTAPLDAFFASESLSENDYICVVTRGHMHDTEAIVWAMRTNAGYIGMMGNPMKNATVCEQATAAGIAPELLTAQRLHAPIGVPLGDKTPAGLAISIVAELVKLRDECRKKSNFNS